MSELWFLLAGMLCGHINLFSAQPARCSLADWCNSGIMLPSISKITFVHSLKLQSFLRLTEVRPVTAVWASVTCLSIHTFMPLSRLSRELMSSPSLQACRQEMTFWLSIVPGRMVSPDRLPRKYWVNRGLVTSPPAHNHTHTGKYWVQWNELGTKDCLNFIEMTLVQSSNNCGLGPPMSPKCTKKKLLGVLY